MYCVKCGVELSESEVCCPLCKTVAYHPDIDREIKEPKYPEFKSIDKQYNRTLLMLVISVIFSLPAIITLLIDLRANAEVNWSGYVIGSLVVAYVSVILPFWFQKPNPVVFVPCSFAAIISLLAYINFATNGSWFISFAFPITGVFAIIITALVTLLKYVRRGYLYIWGGTMIATGLYCWLAEIFSFITFNSERFIFWSIYPMIVLVTLGLLLIVVAICKPLRQSLERIFFI